jgi:hypothetical protein
MNGMISARLARLAVALIAATALLAAAAGAASAASPEVIYKNIPSAALPGLGFDSDSVWEFGGEVEFAGTARTSPTVAVELESYACQEGSVETCHTSMGAKFEWPITLSVYKVGSLGSPIARITKMFKIPYRPSESAKCPNEGWTKGYGKECAFAKGHKISFALPGATLPAQAIIAVAYNTESYGNEPTGTAGPENSLNVGMGTVEVCEKESAEKQCEEWGIEPEKSKPSVGTDPLPEQVFLNTTYAAIDCGGTLGSFGPTGIETEPECNWKYFQPAFEVKAR